MIVPLTSVPGSASKVTRGLIAHVEPRDIFFVEVSRLDTQSGGIGQLHDRLTRPDELIHIHGDIGDEAIEWRDEFRLIDLGLHGGFIRFGLIDFGLHHRHILCQRPGLQQIEARLRRVHFGVG